MTDEPSKDVDESKSKDVDESKSKAADAPARPPSEPRTGLPTPQEAALEAARIVSEIVDIESTHGAVIAAAAAAGAAAAAADAHKQARELPAGSANAGDPLATVKLSRERILQALSDDSPAEIAAEPAAAERRERRARTEPGIRGEPDPNAAAAVAATVTAAAARAPSADDSDYDDDAVDPVAIAAAAIARLRTRAVTDLGHLRVHYQRHDLLVLLFALVLIIVAGRIHAALVTPPNVQFQDHGLTFEHSQAWLAAEPVAEPSPRLVHDATGTPPAKNDKALYHVELTSSVDASARIEVMVDVRPQWSNVVTLLDLDRRTRWGELYSLDDSSVRSIAGHDWLRTEYRYAHADAGDVPRIDRAIEYATEDRDQIYVLTLFGTPSEISRVEDVVAPSLRVQTQTGVPLIPQTGRLTARAYPSGVGRAFESTVMIVVADLIDGRLKARGGGSGVIVGGDGSVLTNYHVIHDRETRLHDVFVIARFAAPDRAPELMCAGRPSRSKLQPEVDLALLKCDMDLDGRTWTPTTGAGVWATLPEARASDIKMGQRLWVLGYPDVGGGGLTLTEGEVEGWTGVDGASGHDFIKTDASITHGNSGGPVVDDLGRLVGIASAFRTRRTETGDIVETTQVGLVRPLQTASMILAYAAAGWTPREGHTEVELTPTAVEAAAEGVRIYTTVVDDATEAPVRDALVMVLHNGITESSIDLNRLDDQAIAWGKTNAQGEVRLKQLVPPGTYTVLVIAPGYEQLTGEGQLTIDDKTPANFDPWGKIGLHSR
ncbi:MAG TPA: trypsin-like peptidase domain-containing protein [Kofleriaceae bacterium]|nr:trypsin-like peptidase domain-containing protein [Kofleriaceae bacterium]